MNPKQPREGAQNPKKPGQEQQMPQRKPETEHPQGHPQDQKGRGGSK